MADTYVDLTGGGSATSPYDTWAKATSSIQTGLTQAGAGGRCFVKTDSSATNKDTAASTRTLTSPGTKSNTTFLIGVVSTTTAEPPTDSDICTRGTDNLPIFECTGSGNDINLAGTLHMAGIRIVSVDRYTQSGNSQIYAINSEISFGGIFFLSTSGSIFVGKNCDLAIGSASSYILMNSGNAIELYGGLISGTSPTYLFTNTGWIGTARLFGVDLTNAGSTLVNAGSWKGGFIKVANCSLPASMTIATGLPNSNLVYIETVGSSNETALGTGESVRDYEKYSLAGTVAHEITAVRTDGADDGADGGFSLALTPNVDSTNECGIGLTTKWFPVWVDGDGSTSKTFTVHIANSGASDYNTDDVRLEILTPDDGGTTKHDFTIDGDIVNGSTTAITDDATSSWGTGASNAQKLSATLTPDFSGLAYARVHFMKRFSASPETLYVDPLLVVS